MTLKNNYQYKITLYQLNRESAPSISQARAIDKREIKTVEYEIIMHQHVHFEW